MRRIAFVALSVGGAMGHYLEGLVTAVSQKAEVHLFAPEHYKGDGGHASIHRFVTGATRNLALVRLLNPFLSRSLWKSILDVSPDVVHLFNGEGYPWAVLFSYWAKYIEVPLLITVHDPVPHPGNLLERLNSWLRVATLLNANAIHIHADVYRGLISSIAPAAYVFVVPHGSLAPRFLRHTRPNITREDMVLFFGRLEAYKGIDLLIESGRFLPGRMKIVIAGPGRLSRAICDFLGAHPERYELHNKYLSEMEVASLFQRAKVCVLPYRQASQSSVPLIAAAFGVPVVATAVGAFIEDIPRINGILARPGDAQSLAGAIMSAEKEQPCYPKDFEFENLADRFIQVYENVARINHS